MKTDKSEIEKAFEFVLGHDVHVTEVIDLGDWRPFPEGCVGITDHEKIETDGVRV